MDPQVRGTRVSVFTVGGAWVKNINSSLANQRIRAGRAKIKHCNSKRLFSIIDLDARIDMRIPGGSLSTIYREQLGNTRSCHTLKRAIGPRESAEYVAWDQGLNQQDLKNGRIKSTATRLRQMEESIQHRFRKTGDVEFPNDFHGQA